MVIFQSYVTVYQREDRFKGNVTWVCVKTYYYQCYWVVHTHKSQLF